MLIAALYLFPGDYEMNSRASRWLLSQGWLTLAAVLENSKVHGIWGLFYFF